MAYGDERWRRWSGQRWGAAGGGGRPGIDGAGIGGEREGLSAFIMAIIVAPNPVMVAIRTEGPLAKGKPSFIARLTKEQKLTILVQQGAARS